MKTSKKILLIVSGILTSLFAGMVMSSVTESPAIGFGVFAMGILTLATQIAFPGLRMVSGSLFTLVNPATITWNGKEVMDMAEAIMEAAYTNPELTNMHQVVTDIVAKQQIAFIGTLSKISKKSTTCGGSPTSKSIPLTEKFWNPERVKFWLEQCADDLEESFWVWGLNNGLDRKDLTDGDFAKFIMQRMEEALVEDVFRIVWFNDTAHADVDDSPAGVLTSGTDLTDYTIIDGLWSQIYDVVSADAARKTAIARNAQATYVLQEFDASDTTAKTVIGIFRDMINNADYRLQEQDGKGLMIICTRSMYNQYKKELLSYTNLESVFTMLQNGTKVLTFDGIPVVPFNFWDRTIRADFDNGTKYYQPHRAVLTVKENIPVGLDANETIKTIKQFYLPKEETTNWKGAYKIDTKVLLDYMVQVAY